VALVRSASADAARLATWVDCCTWRLILRRSRRESSSVAEATVCTLVEAFFGGGRRTTPELPATFPSAVAVIEGRRRLAARSSPRRRVFNTRATFVVERLLVSPFDQAWRGRTCRFCASSLL